MDAGVSPGLQNRPRVVKSRPDGFDPHTSPPETGLLWLHRHGRSVVFCRLLSESALFSLLTAGEKAKKGRYSIEMAGKPCWNKVFFTPRTPAGQIASPLPLNAGTGSALFSRHAHDPAAKAGSFLFQNCYTGTDFENLRVQFLGEHGFHAKKTDSNDGGIDIIATSIARPIKYSLRFRTHVNR